MGTFFASMIGSYIGISFYHRIQEHIIDKKINKVVESRWFE